MKTAIILSYDKSLRYKTLYPKCLIESKNRTLLESQVDFLRLNGFSNIYLVGGYRIDRLNHIHDINVLYYQQYEKTSEIAVIKYALNIIKNYTELFIVSGDTFLPKKLIDTTNSTIITNNKPTGVGCYCSGDNVTRMSYDSLYKWSKALYLDKDITQSLNKLITNQYFLIELINNIIDKNYTIKRVHLDNCYNIETKRDLVKLNELK